MSAIFGELMTLGKANGPDVPLKVLGDEHYARYEDLRGYTAVYDTELGLFCYARLAAGTLRSTGVALAQAPPRAAASPPGSLRGQGTEGGGAAVAPLRADVEEMLNGANYTRNGNICSAHEYFQRVSSGKLDYTNVVVGPFTLSRNRQFYVNNLLIEEALQLAVAAGLDLKQFDSRNEGIIDALNVLYAGQTQYNGDLWPHNFSIDLRFGSMRTDLYLLTSQGPSRPRWVCGVVWIASRQGWPICRRPISRSLSAPSCPVERMGGGSEEWSASCGRRVGAGGKRSV